MGEDKDHIQLFNMFDQRKSTIKLFRNSWYWAVLLISQGGGRSSRCSTVIPNVLLGNEANWLHSEASAKSNCSGNGWQILLAATLHSSSQCSHRPTTLKISLQPLQHVTAITSGLEERTRLERLVEQPGSHIGQGCV